MKHLSAVCLYIILNFFNIGAQNYQTFYSDRIAYFNNNQASAIECIKVDSVRIQPDSVFYLMPTIQEFEHYNCFEPNETSWIGKKILIRKGWNIYINKDNDSIKIKTDALPDSSWIAYIKGDSIKVIAKLLSQNIQFFLGLTDTIKTIGFKIYVNERLAENENLNNLQIAISKKYGIIKTLDFYLFPRYNASLNTGILQEFDLIGLSKPAVGVQNLTWFEVNDFQPGDVLHIVDEYSDWNPFTNKGTSTSQKSILKYLTRYDNTGSIFYAVERWNSTFKRIEKWDSTSTSYYHDTINSIIQPNPLFDKLPGEIIVSDGQFNFCTMTNYNRLTKYIDGSMYYRVNDTCWSIVLVDGCLSTDDYFKGLGGPYYECSSMFAGMISSSRTFVYYKKGNETWGNPLSVISEMYNSQTSWVFPNPANRSINVVNESFNLPARFVIYDMEGRTLINKRVTEKIISINLEMIPDGIYLYSIIYRDKSKKQGKIIKQARE